MKGNTLMKFSVKPARRPRHHRLDICLAVATTSSSTSMVSSMNIFWKLDTRLAVWQRESSSHWPLEVPWHNNGWQGDWEVSRNTIQSKSSDCRFFSYGLLVIKKMDKWWKMYSQCYVKMLWVLLCLSSFSLAAWWRVSRWCSVPNGSGEFQRWDGKWH